MAVAKRKKPPARRAPAAPSFGRISATFGDLFGGVLKAIAKSAAPTPPVATPELPPDWAAARDEIAIAFFHSHVEELIRQFSVAHGFGDAPSTRWIEEAFLPRAASMFDAVTQDALLAHKNPCACGKPRCSILSVGVKRSMQMGTIADPFEAMHNARFIIERSAKN
jgi:hypothetical protein